jgi:hypothetical protein
MNHDISSLSHTKQGLVNIALTSFHGYVSKFETPSDLSDKAIFKALSDLNEAINFLQP